MSLPLLVPMRRAALRLPPLRRIPSTLVPTSRLSTTIPLLRQQLPRRPVQWEVQQRPLPRQGSYEYEYFENRPPPFWQNKRVWVWTGVGGSIFGLYYVSHLESVPITGRKRFVDVSPKQERAMAEMAFGQVIAQYRGQILPSWHPYSKFVREIADRLITVTPGVRNRDWDVYVIDDPQKNAFVLPDGKIFVFTGLLPIVRDADGMAAVLGHEMAHQIARHAAEKLSWTKISVIAQLVIATVFDPGMLLSRIFLEYGILMPFSRKMESEADYIGLILMAQACYNPEAAIGMWQRMAAADRQKVPQYLSTHPSSDQRIEKIREWMPEALKARAASDCLTIPVAFRAAADRFWL